VTNHRGFGSYNPGVFGVLAVKSSFSTPRIEAYLALNGIALIAIQTRNREREWERGMDAVSTTSFPIPIPVPCSRVSPLALQ
jgi:hypothetical protein